MNVAVCPEGHDSPRGEVGDPGEGRGVSWGGEIGCPGKGKGGGVS